MTTEILHLRCTGVSLVLDCRGDRLPRVLHWGADLGPLDDGQLLACAAALVPQRATSTMDEVVPFALLPEQSAGWAGTPGLAAHRDGRDFSPRLALTDVEVRRDGDAGTVRIAAADPHAALGVELELELGAAGLLRLRATVRNDAEAGREHPALTLDGLTLALPVPTPAQELLDLTGRHLRERTPQRHPFTLGTHAREGRAGRTGLDASTLLVAGSTGFGFRHGEVWGLHVGWSGNHREVAEALPGGTRWIGGGELLLPGEVRLEPGASYASPWVYASYGGQGLDELAGRFHAHLRARPHHPSTPRPVTLNTWEAVYFDQDLDRLRGLADLGARVGAERFVLDDGWFRGRVNDHAGLGDWYVDTDRWPDGLTPVVDHVKGLGLQFGLWVEPEMVNPDSDLARAHPDWLLQPEGGLPPLSRHQQVLDVARPEAFDHVLERLDTLVTEYDIDYLKWDHNRDLVDAGHPPTGTAGVHEQTLATYRLMDELRRRHPHLEIESCSSGGGRVDLGVLERTDRVWASDCIDPLERQSIQRWTALLLPPELTGAHVGAPVAHTTGRRHTLDFRAGTALFGHLGIEWDLAEASEADLDRLTAWVGAYRDLRELLHTGDVVRSDHPDPALWVHGVVAPDRSRALYALVTTATSTLSPPGPVRLPGLDPDASYRFSPRAPGDDVQGPGLSTLPWWDEGVTVTGAVAGEVGVQAPLQFPERLVLVEAVQV